MNTAILKRITVAVSLLLALQMFFAPRLEGDGENLASGMEYDAGTVVTGIVMPRQSVTLGPVSAGRIARLLVEEGQVVRQGDLVASLDDRVQKARVTVARIKAESTVDRDLARVRWEAAKREYDRLAKLGEHASSKELKEARTEVDLTHLEYQSALKGHELAQEQLMLEELRLDELRIHAPFTGYVTGLEKRVGETVDEREGVIAMIQLDELDVCLDCPLALASKIRAGSAWDVLPVDDRWPRRVGKAVYVSHVADPASQTFKVKLRVSNDKTQWVTGLKVRVDFGKACCDAGIPRKENADGETSPKKVKGQKARSVSEEGEAGADED